MPQFSISNIPLLPSDLKIRLASPDDADSIARLVRELAVYERLTHEVVSTADDFRRVLSQPDSTVEVLLAELAGRAVGFALFFQNFSTFVGRPGLYLEDLFVEPGYRRRGIGLALFQELFRFARHRNYGRMEWAVLDWNQPAIDFYTKKLDARLLKEWRICRVELR
jgi:GNAT superfamily N-acetyltransferase